MAPYASFNMDIEPLANSSFFSHEEDNDRDDDDDMQMMEDGDDDEEEGSSDLNYNIRRPRRSSHSQYSDEEEDELYPQDHDSSVLHDDDDDDDDQLNTSQDSPINDNDVDEDEEEEEEDDDDDEDSGNLNQMVLQATSTLYASYSPYLREMGHEHTIWSLSTAKPGNGVEQIRDGNTDTYWQSDGGQPHLLNIQFMQRKPICAVCFYLDYNLDESYTPKTFSVRVGMTFHDLEEIRVVELNEPVGWITIPLWAKLDPLDDPEEDEDDNDLPEKKEDEMNKNGNKNDMNIFGILHDNQEELQNDKVFQKQSSDLQKSLKRPVRAHFIQICVVSMHQNGRDTHIRQVKLFGPRNDEHLHHFNLVRMRTNFPHSAPSTHTNRNDNSIDSFMHRRSSARADRSSIGSHMTQNTNVASYRHPDDDDDNGDDDNSFRGYERTAMNEFDVGFRHKFQTVDMTQFNTIR